MRNRSNAGDTHKKVPLLKKYKNYFAKNLFFTFIKFTSITSFERLGCFYRYHCLSKQ